MTTIQVTADDIRDGFKHNCYECPVALAIRRVIKSGLEFRVGRGSVTFLPSYHRIELGIAASQFISRFDQSAPVSPFEFELDIPSPFLGVSDAVEFDSSKR